MITQHAKYNENFDVIEYVEKDENGNIVYSEEYDNFGNRIIIDYIFDVKVKIILYDNEFANVRYEYEDGYWLCQITKNGYGVVTIYDKHTHYCIKTTNGNFRYVKKPLKFYEEADFHKFIATYSHFKTEILTKHL